VNNLVSIIIPCYNAQLTIERAIRSVLMQTYLNIEIIVINDGSDDESGRIIQNMMSEYKNIILISTKNKGVSSARNRGIRVAAGKYVAFLDADDIYAQNFIEVLVYGIEHYDCDTAYCRWTRSNFEGNDISFNQEHQQEFLKKQMLKRKHRISFCNYIYIRDILNTNNILFPEDLKYGEDTMFIMEYLAHCKNAVSTEASMYQYCNNKASAMNSVTWCMTDGLEAVKRIEQILVDTPIYEEYCRFAFSRAVWAKAKDFARAKEHELFLRLDNEYNVRKYMKQLIRQSDAEVIVKISAFIYCMNKDLFYKIILRIMN